MSWEGQGSTSLKSSVESIVSSTLVERKKEVHDPEKDYLAIPTPNIIEFVFSPQYLNIPSVYDHKRQYQVLRDLFQCRCPICNSSKPDAIDCWDKGREYLESEALLVWDPSINDDRCPKCGSTRQEFEEDKLLDRYNQLHGIVGMRSGKTATVAMIGTYVEHVLLTIALGRKDAKLANYFGLLPKQPFEVTYIASTEVQSSDTIWAYYRSFRSDSPWFRRYVTWVKIQEKKQDTPVGMERWVYKETIREINNEHIGVKFNSKNSNSSGLAGRTRIASFVDELCRFKQTESSMGAEESYRVMENSLRTVRSAVLNKQLIRWLGLMASISSPISVEDKGMELLYKSTKISKMYAFHYATWEFNPEEKREYYDEAYEKDPVGTERDFGAKPPLAANPLIRDPDKFEERAVEEDLVSTAEIEIMPFIDKTGQRYHKAMMTSCKLLRDAPRYVCFPPNTKLLIDNKLKCIKDVKINDRVITHKDRQRKVYKILKNKYDDKLYKISTHKICGFSIRCTKDHPIAVYSNNNILWKRASEVTKDDFIRISHIKSVLNKKYIKLSDYIDIKQLRKRVKNHGRTRPDTLPDKIRIDNDFMRLIGYYLSEGSITKKRQYMRFTFGIGERRLADDVKNIIKEKFGFNVTIMYNSKRSVIDVIIGSIILSHLFVAICGRGCRGKFLPQWIMTLPHNLQKSLLIGLYRGDGTCLIRKNNKYMVTLGLVNKQLIHSAWQILLRLGINASISETKKPKLGKSKVWLCRYYTDNINLTTDIWPELHGKLSNARESYFVIRNKTGIYYKVNKIKTSRYSGTVYNLEVKQDHSYTVSTNFTVHNCFDAGQNFDSFAGAAGHLEIKQLQDNLYEYITVVDWLMRILPSNDMEVWFDSCVDIIDVMIKYQKIAQVEFDRWNSVTLIQQIRNKGVRAEQISIKAEDYIQFVSDSIMGRVMLLPKEEGDDNLDPPFKSPAATGLYELERLERSIDDKKISNPRKGQRRGWDSDDVAVVLVHLHKMCQGSQVMPTGAKLRSREARLKREEVGGQQWQMGQAGTVFSPGRLGVYGAGSRRW